MRDRGEHALHQHVGVGGDSEIEAEEFMLRVQCHRRRSAQAEEVNLPRLNQQVDRFADQVGIKHLAHAVEGRDGAAENLAGVGFRVVIGFHRAADVGGAAGQALGQLQLQLRIAADVE